MSKVWNYTNLFSSTYSRYSFIILWSERNSVSISSFFDFVNPNYPILRCKCLFKESKFDILVSYKALSIHIKTTTFTLVYVTKSVIIHFVHHTVKHSFRCTSIYSINPIRLKICFFYVLVFVTCNSNNP